MEILGEASLSTEAERHWSEPYNYELTVTIVPVGPAVEALRTIGELGVAEGDDCSKVLVVTSSDLTTVPDGTGGFKPSGSAHAPRRQARYGTCLATSSARTRGERAPVERLASGDKPKSWR